MLKMLQDVRKEGDDAVRRYAKLLDGAELSTFQVSKAKLAEASASVSSELRESLELAAQRVRQFHQCLILTTHDGKVDNKISSSRTDSRDVQGVSYRWRAGGNSPSKTTCR